MSSHPDDWRRVPLAPRLCVEPDSRRNAVLLPALTGATDWRRRAGDRVGTLWIAALGAHNLVPHDGIGWPSPGLAELGRRLRDALPTLRLIGAVLPRQPGRARVSLLGRMTGNLVVVKVGAVDAGIEREAFVLERLARRPLPGIATPTPLAHGVVTIADASDDAVDGTLDVAYLVTFGLSVRRQRPAMDEPLHTFEAELGHRLADLPRPDGTPDDHVPIHGDVAPYNLRRTSRGLALFDWEGARWGPPGADVALYRRRCELIRRGAPIPPPDELLEAM